jgi:threonine dehydrogenase-like Zn-dependent dehydrogenase
MSTTVNPDPHTTDGATGTMRAAVFERPGRIALHERPIPACGPNDAIVRVAMTTICGTDVHWRPVASSATSPSA